MDMKPRRSTLSSPGHVIKMHSKALSSQADVIMLDLEDSVPIEAKEKARDQVISSILSMDWSSKILTVRINGLGTPFGYKDLLKVAEKAGDHLDAFVIPKVNHPGDIHFVSRMLKGVELYRNFQKKINIEVSIETASGIENITEIARASRRIQSFVFGIADYSASIGARLLSISGHGENEMGIHAKNRWNFAMSRIINSAKTHGFLAIDAPYGNFKDVKGLHEAATISSNLGFDGKWAIHPDQLETINHVFSPTSKEIEKALKILEAYEEAENKGLGAASVDGRMVDLATVRLAKRVRSKAKFLNMI